MEKGRTNLESLRVSARDRVGGSFPAEVTESDASTAWLVRILIPVAYFAPGLAILVPVGSTGRTFLVVAAVGVCSALFAAFFLDRADKHRLRLMLLGGGIALTFLFSVLKPYLGK